MVFMRGSAQEPPPPEGGERAELPLPIRPWRAKFLRRELALGYFCLICLIGISTAFAAFLVHGYERTVLEAEAETRDISFFLADHASRLFEAADLILAETLADVEDREWDSVASSYTAWSALRRLSDRFPYIDAITLLDEKGQVRLASTVFPAPDINASDRVYFQSIKEKDGGLYISNRLHSRATDRPGFVIARSLMRDGNFRGAAALILDLRYFREFYGSLHLRHRPVISLFREDFLVVAQYPEESEDQPSLQHDKGRLADALSHSSRGTATETLPATAAERIFSYQKVGEYPIYVTVAIPRQEIDQEWWSQVRIPGALGASALAALAGLTFLAFRQAYQGDRAKRELEERVEARTADLRSVNAQMEVLFREVHHRVKNNLQVISSMLRLQSGRVSDDEVRYSLQNAINRVHAMSLVHEQLYNSKELANVDFGDYLQSLVDQLTVSYGTGERIAVDIDVGNIRLDLNTAILLSLIVNEILSNAFKYAFPGNRRGRVSIAVNQASDGGMLVITDDGKGLPPGFDWRKGKGLGLEIVRSLSGKLKGAPSLRTADGLTTFSMNFRRVGG
jgi:two-component sensor histidine kinase